MCEALGLEIHIGPRTSPGQQSGEPQRRRQRRGDPALRGPPPPDSNAESRGAEFAAQHAVDVHPLPVPMASVGYSPTGCAWFGGDFLAAFSLRAELCRVVMLFDDSMWPPLARGSNLLVDTGRRELEDGEIFAIEADGRLLIRRAQLQAEEWSFVSSKASTAPIPLSDAVVVGKVVWVARLIGLGIDAADALKGMSG